MPASCSPSAADTAAEMSVGGESADSTCTTPSCRSRVSASSSPGEKRPTTATRAAASRARASRSSRRSSAESNAARAVPVEAAASRSARSTHRRTTVMPVGVRSSPATRAASQLAPVTAARTGTVTSRPPRRRPAPAPGRRRRGRPRRSGRARPRCRRAADAGLRPAAAERAAAGLHVLADRDPVQHQLGPGRRLAARAPRARRRRRPPGPCRSPATPNRSTSIDDPPLLVAVRSPTAATGQQLAAADRAGEHQPVEVLGGREVAAGRVVEVHRRRPRGRRRSAVCRRRGRGSPTRPGPAGRRRRRSSRPPPPTAGRAAAR